MKHLLNNAASAEVSPWVTLDTEGIHYSCEIPEIAYSIKNVSSPSVTWSATEATITFTGVKTYSDGTIEETQETQVVTFEQNKSTTDKPMEFTANTEYVDLGLPSGLKWAKCNLGATSETEYGAYFQWGDTNGYAKAKDKGGTSTARNITDSFTWNDVTVDYTVKQGGASGQGFTWDTAPFNNGSSSFDSTYFNAHKSEWLDGDVLKSEYDAATQNMGDGWRMPTEVELKELVENTTSTWYAKGNTEFGGVAGRKFTASNGNYIFIPAAGGAYDSSMGYVGYGSVWSSSLNASSTFYAWDLKFSNDTQGIYGIYSYYGFSVRGVRE